MADRPDKPPHQDCAYLNEQVLIAMPTMEDPNFQHSVTLLCEHNEQGALGITINRELGMSVGEVFKQIDIDYLDSALDDKPVLIGGPVHSERGFVLHTPMEDFESSIQINDWMMITTSRDVLHAIAENKGPEEFLLALGCSGWSSGQLEGEIRANAWLEAPASRELVFELPFDQRWEKAISNLGIDVMNLHLTCGHA